MNEPVKASVTVDAGLLAFAAESGVSGAQLLSFVDAVNRDIATVTRELVAQLKKEKINARVQQEGNTYLIIQDGITPLTLSPLELLEAEPNERPSRIRISVRSSDAPATINALRGFFRDWRAVAGLIAVGGAWQLGQWVMQVRREAQ